MQGTHSQESELGGESLPERAARVFISYAHEDAAIANGLEQQLRHLPDIEVFLDSRELRAGREFTREIEQWIETVDLPVLVVSSHFLNSEYIRDIELPALQERSTTFPWLLAGACTWREHRLIGSRLSLQVGDLEIGPLNVLSEANQAVELARIADSVRALALEERRSRQALRQDMSETGSNPQPEGLRSGAERLRDLAASRADLRAVVIETLTRDLGAETAAPLALVGPGGIGKSELAASVIDDPAIRRAFDDRVHSVYIGTQDDLTGPTLELLAELGVPLEAEEEDEALRQLRSVAASRTALFVFDDVLDGSAALALSLRGSHSRVIFTGRDADVFAHCADIVEMPPLSRDDIAVMLSAAGRTPPSDQELDTIAEATAGRLHHLQLVIRDFDATQNWDETTRGLARLSRERDQADETHLGPVRLAYGRLSRTDQDRFAALSIFPRSHQITIDQARRAWGTDLSETLASVDALDRAALVERVADDLIALPRTNHEYATTQLSTAARVHRRFLDSVEEAADRDVDWGSLEISDTYTSDNLVRHLVRANDRGALSRLARSVEWLARRILDRGAAAVAADLDRIGEFTEAPDLKHLAEAVRQRADVLHGLPDADSVAATLGYLLNEECAAAGIRDFGSAGNLLRPLSSPPRPSPLLLNTYAAQSDSVIATQVIRDERLLAIATMDGAVRVWDIDDVVLRAEYRTGVAAVSAVAAIPGVIAIARTMGGEHSVILWDYNHRVERDVRPMMHSRGITALAFAPDGLNLASASADGEVKVWEVRTGHAIMPTIRLSSQETVGRVEPPRNVTVRSCAYSPDGTLLAIAGSDGVVRLCDSSTGDVRDQIAAGSVPLNSADGEEALAALTSLDFAPDDSRLVTTDAAGEIRLWSVEGAQLARASVGGTALLAARFSPDGLLVATVGAGGVQLWKTDGLVPAHDFFLGQTGLVQCCTYVNDGTRLITGGVDGKVRVWALDRLDEPQVAHTVAPAGQLTDCDIGPTGEDLLAANSTGEVEVLKSRTGETVVSHDLTSEPLAACAHAPTESALLALTESGVVHYMRLGTNSVTEIARCIGEDVDPVRTGDIRDLISFAPQGDCAAVVGAEALALIERVEDRWVEQDLVQRWSPSRTNARVGSRCAAFLGDQMMAIGYDDGRIALVRRSTGEIVEEERPHEDPIVGCAVDQSTGELITACQDGTVVFWTTDGLEITRFVPDEREGDLTGLAFSDKYVYTIGTDGTLQLSPRTSGSTTVTIGLGEPGVAVSCKQSLVVATTQHHIHRFWEL